MSASKKVVLISPPNEKYIGALKANIVNEFPPLSLAYIASVLRENEIEVAIIDGNTQRLSFDEIINQLAVADPQFIGISVFTAMYSKSRQLADLIKMQLPHVKIVFGGPHVNALYKEVMEEVPYVDYCVYGEGEFTMLELVKSENAVEALEDIRGLCYRDKGKVIVTAERPFLEDLDLLPFPARDLLPFMSYTAPQSLGGGKKFTIVISSRGCPFKCQYCVCQRTWKRQRRRSAINILSEIEMLYRDYGIRKLRFEDDLFTLDKKWATEICNGLIEKKLNKIIWETNAKVGTLSPELLKIMKRANCKSITLGLEFGTQRLLDMAQKGIKIEAMYETVKMIKNAGIQAKGSFMMGYPTETKKEIEETIKLSQELNLDYAIFSIVVPFYGTPLHDYVKEKNLLKSTNWDYYDFSTPKTIVLEDLQEDELLALQKKAHKDFWYRPGQIFNILLRHHSFILRYSFYNVSNLIVRLLKFNKR